MSWSGTKGRSSLTLSSNNWPTSGSWECSFPRNMAAPAWVTWSARHHHRRTVKRGRLCRYLGRGTYAHCVPGTSSIPEPRNRSESSWCRWPEGEKLGAWSLTKPEAGSDAGGTQTTARLDGDHWILNGQKTFTTHGTYGDICVAMAVTDKSAGHHGISAFILEKGTPGFHPGKKKTNSVCAPAAPRPWSLKTAGFPRTIFWASWAMASSTQ